MIRAKLDAKLPAGLACRVLYQGSVVDVPEPRDPFEVCNAARVKVFGGQPLKRDVKFDALMKRRKEAA